MLVEDEQAECSMVVMRRRRGGGEREGETAVEVSWC